MKFSSIILAGFVSGSAAQSYIGSPYARVGAPLVGNGLARPVGAYGLARPGVVGAYGNVGAYPGLLGARVASPYFGRGTVAPRPVAAVAPVVMTEEQTAAAEEKAAKAKAATEAKQEALIEAAKAAFDTAKSDFESGLSSIKSAEFDAQSEYLSLMAEYATTDADDAKEFTQIINLRDVESSMAGQNAARKNFAALRPTSSLAAIRGASLQLQQADNYANRMMYGAIQSLNIGDIPMGDTFPVTTQYKYIEKASNQQSAEEALKQSAIAVGTGEAKSASAYLAAKRNLAIKSKTYGKELSSMLGESNTADNLALDIAFMKYDDTRASYETAYAAYDKNDNLYTKHKMEIASMKLDGEEMNLTDEFMGYWGNANNAKLGPYLAYKQAVNSVNIAKKENAAILPQFQYKYADLAQSLTGN